MLGDKDGYVPLAATNPSLRSVDDALPLAAMGKLPSPDEVSAERVPEAHLSFTTPVEKLGKLWGIGLNYADHASDLNEERPTEPASFMKPSTAAIGPGGPIRLPSREITDQVTAEAELALVIGQTCSNVDESEVDEVIAGYVPVIDMTAEDILERNPRFLTRAKSFDSFLVFGHSLVTTDEIEDLADCTVRTIINGEVAAENQIKNMMTPPRELVAFHSQIMTLEPGDIISTGTPGASQIAPTDDVRADIDRIGAVEAEVVK